MKDEPEGMDGALLADAVRAGWGIDVRSFEHLPLGFGSYHWAATDRRGQRHFVTVDDLGHEDGVQEAAFSSLGRALATAATLHRDAGLSFVVAPVLDDDGAPVRRLDARHAISVFPYLSGEAGHFGPHAPADRAGVLQMLADLHRATPAVTALALRADLDVPGRSALQDALNDLDAPWTGGPYAEPARQLLSGRARTVEQMLADVDQLAHQLGDVFDAWVVTHGEPHPGNVLRTCDGLRLVDWDTVRIAPAERDLWMVADRTDDALSAYARATGRRVSHAGLDFYRRCWDLADIAVYVETFRRPHRATADVVASWTYLQGYLAGDAPTS